MPSFYGLKLELLGMPPQLPSPQADDAVLFPNTLQVDDIIGKALADFCGK